MTWKEFVKTVEAAIRAQGFDPEADIEVSFIDIHNTDIEPDEVVVTHADGLSMYILN